MGEQNNFTRRMFIKGMATSFGALPVFAWPRWAQAFYYNLGFFKKGSAASLYVEDVFSTYLYTGTSGTQTITNGIDLSNKGGLVWIKGKDSVRNHIFRDSARGLVNGLSSNLTDAQLGWPGMASFNTTGFNLGDDGTPGTNTQSGNLNQSGVKFASWTFRKAAKFFDIVTYTGNGNAGGQTVAHSLGSDPGMVIIKRTDAVDMWIVHHRSQAGKYLQLESTAAATTFSWVTTSPTNFVLANNGGAYNAAGATYVAYLFAHDTAADGMIQCGSFTTDGAGTATVALGWEPQFALFKISSGTGDWETLDTMRAWPNSASSRLVLRANSSAAEVGPTALGGYPTATGFVAQNLSASSTYTYMAIRRGPMKTPTDATKVFIPIAYNQAVNTALTVGFPADMAIHNLRTLGNAGWIEDKLRGFASANSAGASKVLDTNSAAAESNWSANNPAFYNFDNTQVLLGSNGGGNPSVAYFFRRAPGFFDQVCYTGTGVAKTEAHNLGVAPELMIVKQRNTGGYNWLVYSATFPASDFLFLNTTNAKASASTIWNATAPTSTVFSLGAAVDVNTSANTYVAYLFASCPGVSKVGSFTGSASDVTVSCGFSGQPRFVLVKRTDSTGDWIVVDSSRGTSVYLTLNTTNNEVSATVITFTTGGFVAKAGTVANTASGANYIFLAIA